MNNKYTKEDYEYMNSLNIAILQKTPSKLKFVLLFWFITIISLIVWAYFAQVDEIVRGSGKVVPFGKNKIVQNLEGGILKKIFVREGDVVKKGDVLLRIDNGQSESEYESVNLKSLELKAKISRLQAEINGVEFKIDDKASKELQYYQNLEYQLFTINKNKLSYETNILKEQLKQKINDLSSEKNNIVFLNEELDIIKKELAILKPLVKEKLKPKSEFLKLSREKNSIERRLSTSKLSIPKLKSAISEINTKITNIREVFKKEGQEEYNKLNAELQRIYASANNLKDKVTRTNVYSPSSGVIQKIYLNTIGGVIRPGENIVEIVPTEENLLIETNIKPEDIAFIHYDQKVKVKFTAYDFSIYGGLDGKVIKISPDTQIDENKKSFYKIYVKTDKNHLSDGKNNLPIIPGMVVSVDILTGKKTILDYILKPILKAKQYTFTER